MNDREAKEKLKELQQLVGGDRSTIPGYTIPSLKIEYLTITFVLGNNGGYSIWINGTEEMQYCSQSAQAAANWIRSRLNVSKT